MADDEVVNEVRLVGRVSTAPERRVLPSGDELWTLRVVVTREEERPPGPDRTPVSSRVRVDALECAAWSARVRRSVAGWRAGDVVEVQGRLRRRFYALGASRTSRVEVEVLRARLIRRATSGRAPRTAASAGTTSP